MQLTYNINKPVNQVFSYLSEIKKFAHIHPLIKKVKIIGINEYMIYEKMNFGFISRSVIYPATIKADYASKKITMEAVVKKLVTIRLHFTITENGNGALIKEEIAIQSKLPVKGIVEKICRKQHGLMFQNMEED